MEIPASESIVDFHLYYTSFWKTDKEKVTMKEVTRNQFSIDILQGP
jgi:hypothetical protein